MKNKTSIIKKRINQFSLWLFLLSSYFFASQNALAIDKVTEQLQVGNKVLIVISSDKRGFWLPEVLEPYQLLSSAGYLVDIASPLGGRGVQRGAFQLSSQQTQWLLNNPILQAKIDNSIELSKVNVEQYRAVYFAGGAGPMFDLVDNEQAHRVTRSIYEAGGIVSADCHGPAALLNVMLSNGQRLIAGKNVTGKANVEEGLWARNNYPFMLEDKLKELGSIYSAQGKGKVHVVVDERVITGQNPVSAGPMAEALIKQLSLLAGAVK